MSSNMDRPGGDDAHANNNPSSSAQSNAGVGWCFLFRCIGVGSVGRWDWSGGVIAGDGHCGDTRVDPRGSKGA
ncbi:hypothetical protein PINS_up021284 [Pythium insidiosum]|nr:hypothetical protein PINS_up021284 [Pythium insidiosum]